MKIIPSFFLAIVATTPIFIACQKEDIIPTSEETRTELQDNASENFKFNNIVTPLACEGDTYLVEIYDHIYYDDAESFYN